MDELGGECVSKRLLFSTRLCVYYMWNLQINLIFLYKFYSPGRAADGGIKESPNAVIMFNVPERIIKQRQIQWRKATCAQSFESQPVLSIFFFSVLRPRIIRSISYKNLLSSPSCTSLVVKNWGRIEYN